MTRIVLALLFTGLLAGCATPKKPSIVYKGKSVDELVDRFGPPDKHFESQDGTHTYRWDIEKKDSNTGLGAYSYDYWYHCEVTAKTDSNNVITNYETRGFDNHPYREACQVLLKYAGGR